MKKVLFAIIALCVSHLCAAQSVPDQMYIYSEGSVVTTLFLEDIDSITCTADSQAIHMFDTVYRFALEDIDSVAFKAPETVYQPGVIRLEGEIRSYIIKVDSLCLTFKGTTPANILPKVGDKLVTMEVGEPFQMPFLGQVKSIANQDGNYIVDCEIVALTDIFDTYFSTSYSDQPASAAARRAKMKDGFYEASDFIEYPEKTIDYFKYADSTDELLKVDDHLCYAGSANYLAYTKVKKTLNYATSLTIQKEQGVTLFVRTITDYYVHEHFELAGSLTANFSGDILKVSIPIPSTLLKFDYEVGWYLSSETKVSMLEDYKDHYRHTFLWNWNSKGNTMLKNINQFQEMESEEEAHTMLEGRVGVGLNVKLGVSCKPVKDIEITSISTGFKVGIVMEGNYVLHKDEIADAKVKTDLYKKLAEVRQRLGAELVWVPLEIKMVKWAVNPFPEFTVLSPDQLPHYDTYAVPRFEDTRLTRNDNGDYTAKVKVSGAVPKTDVGFALLNQDHPEDSTYIYSLLGYTDKTQNVETVFPNKSMEDTYKAYPLVKYMDIEMIAEPAGELLPCSDTYHPHAIDLGLSVNWACKNIGANAPQDTGSYYAFAELQPKKVYSQASYSYCSWDYNNCSASYFFINGNGTSISGLDQYDVASAAWVNGWRIPTKEEMQELVDSCTWEPTTLNGVEGCRVTGPNGNSIFLPMAGVIMGSSNPSIVGSNKPQGAAGRYWTANWDTKTDYINSGYPYAWSLIFNTSKAGVNSIYKFYGAQIRAVKDKQQQ